jgi:ketosteroid isomerase-like protein
MLLSTAAMLGFSSIAAAAEPMRLADAGTLFTRWILAYKARDADKLMAIYDKSLVYSAQGEADQTFNELKASYQGFFASRMPPTYWKAIPKEIQTQGDLAIVISIWEQRTRGTAGAPDEVIARTRSVDVFKRIGGAWKIVRTVNYPEAN